MVDVFRAKDAIMEVTKEGLINKEAANLAHSAGLKVVMDRCPKKELSKPYWTSQIK